MINKKEEFLLFAAESTQFIIKTEKILKENGIECRIIPLPKEIDASCGLAIRTELQNADRIQKIFNENKIELKRYKIEKMGFKKKIDKY
jgi:hypothetical protein